MTAVDDVARADGVSARAIWRWIGMIEGVRDDDRLAYLAPRHRAGIRAPRRAAIDLRFGSLMKADVLRDAAPSVTAAYDRVCDIARHEGLPIPALQAVRRWLKREVSASAWVLARKGREALKQRLALFRVARTVSV